MITRNGTFCVNVTASEHAPLALRFSGKDGVHGAEKFLEGRWLELATGSPVLADAPAVFDCELVSAVNYRTHTIFIGGVVASQVSPGRSALLYRNGAFADLCGNKSSGTDPRLARRQSARAKARRPGTYLQRNRRTAKIDRWPLQGGGLLRPGLARFVHGMRHG